MDLRYPIGPYEHDGPVGDDDLERWIGEIARLPAEMRRAVEPLTPEQLDTRYRPGGWTLRQVVHHVPDSHLNCYVRFKWALTEDEPAIKAYFEDRWAELADYGDVPVETALELLDVIHRKWVILLRGMSREQMARRFVHPELGAAELAWVVGMYAWHGRHHLAHITTTSDREGWRADRVRPAFRALRPDDVATCEAILRALPEWFGIEEAIVDYVRDLAAMETWVAELDGRVVGFATLNRRTDAAAEIHVIAVRKEAHGRGVGRALVQHLEDTLAGGPIEYLQVKTLGPSRPDESYAKTRGFYRHVGFRPLEENRLWGDVNPCLIFVKALGRR